MPNRLPVRKEPRAPTGRRVVTLTERKAFQTEKAPTAIGPYSQAVRAGDSVYLSGQIPLIPGTMELVDGGIQDQAEQVLANLGAVCEAAGGSLADVVKVTVYLTDMAQFGAINEALEGFLDPPFPARAVVGVAALPKGAQVEMEAVLHLPPSPGEAAAQD